MPTVSTDAFILELAQTFASKIPAIARSQAASLAEQKSLTGETPSDSEIELLLDRCALWTDAVHQVFRQLAMAKGWKLYPDEKPGRGEYLCDFMLFEEGYGCRVACESQWYWSAKRHEIDWAFDKLRGVKADIKLLIHEGEEGMAEEVMESYLSKTSQLSPDEAYVALRWAKPKFLASAWRPRVAGKPSNVRFTKLDV